VSAEVRKLFMKISGSAAPYCRRWCSTWRAITSRKDSPRRTQSNDLARAMPIEVPNPPLSLITTVAPTASEAASSLTSRSSSDRMSCGSIVSSAIMPVSPCSICR